MEPENYLDELDNLTKLTISKWRYISKILLMAFTSDSQSGRILIFSLKKISKAAGEYGEDLLTAYENSPNQAFLIHSIHHAESADTVVELLSKVDEQKCKSHLAIIFLGIITAKNLELNFELIAAE